MDDSEVDEEYSLSVVSDDSYPVCSNFLLDSWDILIWCISLWILIAFWVNCTGSLIYFMTWLTDSSSSIILENSSGLIVWPYSLPKLSMTAVRLSKFSFFIKSSCWASGLLCREIFYHILLISFSVNITLCLTALEISSSAETSRFPLCVLTLYKLFTMLWKLTIHY